MVKLIYFVTPNIVVAILFTFCQLDRCLIIIFYYLWPPLSGLETYLAFFQGRVGPEVDVIYRQPTAGADCCTDVKASLKKIILSSFGQCYIHP